MELLVSTDASLLLVDATTKGVRVVHTGDGPYAGISWNDKHVYVLATSGIHVFNWTDLQHERVIRLPMLGGWHQLLINSVGDLLFPIAAQNYVARIVAAELDAAGPKVDTFFMEVGGKQRVRSALSSHPVAIHEYAPEAYVVFRYRGYSMVDAGGNLQRTAPTVVEEYGSVTSENVFSHDPARPEQLAFLNPAGKQIVALNGTVLVTFPTLAAGDSLRGVGVGESRCYVGVNGPDGPRVFVLSPDFRILKDHTDPQDPVDVVINLGDSEVNEVRMWGPRVRDFAHMSACLAR